MRHAVLTHKGRTTGAPGKLQHRPRAVLHYTALKQKRHHGGSVEEFLASGRVWLGRQHQSDFGLGLRHIRKDTIASALGRRVRQAARSGRSVSLSVGLWCWWLDRLPELACCSVSCSAWMSHPTCLALFLFPSPALSFVRESVTIIYRDTSGRDRGEGHHYRTYFLRI